MLAKLALQNIKLNRRRTFITLALSTIAASFFIFYIGMLKGSFIKVYKDSLDLYQGYVQITGENYLDDPSNDNLIFNAQSVLQKVLEDKRVVGATMRYEGFGLYATDETAFGARLTAITPSKELAMTKLHKFLHKGRYLRDDDSDAIVIGAGLAKQLNIDIGDTLSVITSDTDNSFAAANLKVVGIIKTSMQEMDATLAFINKPYFDTFMNADNIATHIIVNPASMDETLTLEATLKRSLEGMGVHVEDWHTFLASMIQMEQMKITSGGTMIALFVLLIFFVVLIYTFLSVQARIKEIGVMRAIGTRPRQIVAILFYEALFLGAISALLGALIGGSLIYYMQEHPMVLSFFDQYYREYGILEAVFPTHFDWNYLLIGSAYIFVLNIIAIIYPAYSVVKIKPIDALNHI